MTIKWKIYRLLNYILFGASSIIFLFLIRLLFKAPGHELLIFSLIFSSGFLSMIILSLINITIMSKTFPDRLLNKRQGRWHIFSVTLNVFALSCLLVALVTLLNEMDNIRSSDLSMGPFLIMATLLITLLTMSIFIFIGQVTLKKYLRSKSNLSADAMVDSIGKEN